MNTYEAKQAAKKERLQNRAAATREKSDALFTEGSEGLKAIPFGQPVMPDHHSYKSDIAYRRRNVNKIDKSFELSKKADRLEARAESVGKGGISADDPAAILKLKKQLFAREEAQEQMKQANTEARKNGEEKPHPAWQLSNNNANINRLKKRIAELDAAHNMETQPDVDGPGYKLVESKEQNRIQFLFDGKPGDEIRSILKRYGFRWSPRNAAWQRQLNQNGRRAADFVHTELTKTVV